MRRGTLRILRMLYRELHYRILKTNVLVAEDEEKMRRKLRQSASLTVSLGLQSLTYLSLGAMMALSMAAVKGNETKGIMFASYCMFPFILGVYTSTMNSSYIVSMGVFDPLKSLPIRTTPLYLSFLTIIDGLPGFAMIIPPAIYVGMQSVASGIVAVAWGLMSLFMGHTLGLLIYSYFGTSLNVGAGKLGLIKNIGKIILIVIVMGIFYVVRAVSGYISSHAATFAGLTSRYFMAFPFSASTVYTPLRSVLILIPYAVAFGLIYIRVLKRLYRGIEEPLIKSGKASAKRFEKGLRTSAPVIAIYVKDMKTLFRRSQLLAAFLIPFYFILPQLFGGGTGEEGAMGLIMMTGAFSIMLSGASMKLDGRAMEIMNSLPVRIRTYALGKTLTMATFPVLSGLTVALLSVYHTGISALKLTPCAFLIPFMSAVLGMAYMSRKMERGISMPDVSSLTMLVMLLIVSVPYAAIGGSFLLLGGWTRWMACYSIPLLVIVLAFVSIK